MYMTTAQDTPKLPLVKNQISSELKDAVEFVAKELGKPWNKLHTFFTLQKVGSPVKGVITVKELWEMLLVDTDTVLEAKVLLKTLVENRTLQLSTGAKLFTGSNI